MLYWEKGFEAAAARQKKNGTKPTTKAIKENSVKQNMVWAAQQNMQQG